MLLELKFIAVYDIGAKLYLCFFFPFQISKDTFPYNLALPIEGEGQLGFLFVFSGEKVRRRKKERIIFLV